jgi:translation elongation factor EF-Tu-like GTPase
MESNERRLYSGQDDFEARIRVFTAAEGGRKTPVFNGIRWDFAYLDDPDVNCLYCIYPDFYAENGDSLSDEPIPIDVELPARMYILRDDMRCSVHRSRLAVGTEFYCQEGGTRVAHGIVTRITGLFVERTTGPID